MQNKFTKISIFISTTIFIIFVIAFYFLYKEIQKKNIVSEKVLTDWQIEESRRNEIKTILRSVEKIKFNNDLLGNHFSKSSNVVPFLDTIDSFAPKVNAEDEIISVEIIPETKELVVGVKVLGSFESVYKFLTLLENSPYEIEFIGTDIQKMETGFKSEKTGKVFSWEGMFKIKLLSFIP